ncbi:MAG: hypothetical protein QM784_21040, partial [Polyangiaceae bacterium]
MVNLLHRHVGVFGLMLVGAAGCRPDVEGRASLVETERVLAIRSEPAEAAPGASVSYSALYVTKDGDVTKVDEVLFGFYRVSLLT